MKELNKVRLLRLVWNKLFNEMRDFDEVNSFLTSIRVPEARNVSRYANRTDILEARIQGIEIDELIRIAQEELDIDISHLTSQPTKPATPKPTKPKNDTSLVKAFISHSTKDKKFANKIRRIFKKYGIIAFVSGEDIKGGEVWRKRIRKEINEMHAFIAMHTDDFSESLWCQQETGLALAREKEVEIIPINFNKEDPRKSFLEEFQYIKRGQKNVETIAKEILDRLKTSDKTNALYSAKIAPNINN